MTGGELFGKAFESWIFHELSARISYNELPAELAFWRLASGIEVDFVVGDMALAIEAKATARVTSDHLKGLRHVVQDHPNARRIVVCLEPKRGNTDDGIEIMPAARFIEALPTLLRSAN
jgi:predicted AAA+ superfamily ATPase